MGRRFRRALPATAGRAGARRTSQADCRLPSHLCVGAVYDGRLSEFSCMTQNPKPASPQPPVRARRAARAAGERIIENASAVFLRAGFKDAGFLLHWPAIAGPHIARVAQPVKWQETQAGAVLTLRLSRTGPNRAAETRPRSATVRNRNPAPSCARFRSPPGQNRADRGA
jgi:hypothetical protein